MSTTNHEWEFKDLTAYWPLHALENTLSPRFRAKHTFRGLDKFNGYLYEERESAEAFRLWSIPDHYANQFALIGVKIMWLQVFLAREYHPKDAIEEQTLLRLRDSCSRMLVFTTDVRQLFLMELSDKFYNKYGALRRPWLKGDEQFRSRSFDSWLHVEYTRAAHHPPNYIQALESQDKHIDPLRRSFDSK
jgi:hypothetical protein